jgi:hypothetical protein
MSARSARPSLKGSLAALLAAGAALHAAPSQACQLRVVKTPEQVRIPFDPFAVSRTAGRLDVELENSGETACELEMVVNDAAGTPIRLVRPAGVEVEFRPREGSAIRRDSTRPGVFTFLIPPKTATRAELDAVALSEGVTEPGDHRADIQLELRRPNGDLYASRLPLAVVLSTPARAQANIAGAAGAFGTGASVDVIDFGPAVTGATKRAFLQVRANTKAKVTINSENKGRLLHEEYGEKAPVFTYALSLDQTPVDLTAVAVRELTVPRTLEGASLPMDFVLGEFAGQMAGTYKDIVTIDIAPM